MISIISAIYKSERYLGQYLTHAKKFADFLIAKNIPFEIIIIPTNPSEKERQLLESVKNETWCRIHEFNKRGLYAAWNEGVRVSKGNVIGPWNADDIRFPEAVIEAEKLAQEGSDISYYPFYIKRYLTLGPISIPVKTRTVNGPVLEFEKRKFETTMTAGPHFMFSKQAFEKVGPFDEQFKIAGDFDWCARAAALGLKFQCGKEFSGVFRVDGNGLSAGANTRLVAENNVVYKRRGALDKVKTGAEALESEYRLDKRLFSGEWFDL